MSDNGAEVRRFFERIKHSLTLQMKIAEYAATDYERLWSLAVSLGYVLDYADFIIACREIQEDEVVPALWRIIRTLQHHADE